MKGLFGGPDRDRTDDLFHAMEARSQLRHRPTRWEGLVYCRGRGVASQTRAVQVVAFLHLDTVRHRFLFKLAMEAVWEQYFASRCLKPQSERALGRRRRSTLLDVHSTVWASWLYSRGFTGLD